MGSLISPKTLAAAPFTSKINKVIPKNTLKDLIKDFKELKVEMSALKRDQKPNISRLVEGSKGYVVRCIWCNNPNHKQSDCGPYAKALKASIVTFREGRLKDATTNEPIRTNFGR